MSSKALKIVSICALGAALAIPFQSANAMGGRSLGGMGGMGGGLGRAGHMGHFHNHGGGGGFGAALAGAGAAALIVQGLAAAHHASAESEGRRLDCYRFGDCHVHVLRERGQAPQAHVHVYPDKAKPKKRAGGRSWGQSYDPTTGVTITSVSNGDGTRTVTVNNPDGSVRQYISR